MGDAQAQRTGEGRLQSHGDHSNVCVAHAQGQRQTGAYLRCRGHGTEGRTGYQERFPAIQGEEQVRGTWTRGRTGWHQKLRGHGDHSCCNRLDHTEFVPFPRIDICINPGCERIAYNGDFPHTSDTGTRVCCWGRCGTDVHSANCDDRQARKGQYLIDFDALCSPPSTHTSDGSPVPTESAAEDRK
jgi:hypothetical protein